MTDPVQKEIEARIEAAEREHQVAVIAEGIVRGLTKWSLYCFLWAMILGMVGIAIRMVLANQ